MQLHDQAAAAPVLRTPRSRRDRRSCTSPPPSTTGTRFAGTRATAPSNSSDWPARSILPLRSIERTSKRCVPAGRRWYVARSLVLERRPASSIEPIRKEQAIGGCLAPFVDPAERDSRLARRRHFAQVGSLIQNRPRSINVRLRMIEDQAARGSRPQSALAVLKDGVGHHRRQALFGLMADPAPVLQAVDARRGSHPKSAVARGGQVPDPVQSRRASRVQDLPSYFRNPSRPPATSSPRGRLPGRRRRCPCSRFLVWNGFDKMAVPIEAAAGGTAQPDLSRSAFQHRPQIRSLAIHCPVPAPSGNSRHRRSSSRKPGLAFHLAATQTPPAGRCAKQRDHPALGVR